MTIETSILSKCNRVIWTWEGKKIKNQAIVQNKNMSFSNCTYPNHKKIRDRKTSLSRTCSKLVARSK